MPQGPYSDAEPLFRETYGDVVRIAYGLLGNKPDAEDIAQNSCCKLMLAWPRVAALPTADNQRAYLIKVAINEALQFLRYPYRKWESPGADAGEQAAVQEPVDEKVQVADELRLTWKAISELPEMRRNVVSLYAAGYEYEEIAARLDINKGTVRSHISYARKQLSRTVPRDWKGHSDEHGG
jgi:RNA polymerase sigma factor (sigma-70 family)